MPQVIKRSLPMGHLRSLIEPSAINEDDRTVELIFSTGHKGLRNGWDGPYYEELSMSPEHIDMSRLQSGAPLLNSHDDSLNSVIGVVERAWLENGVGKALVRFSSDSESDKIYQKVKDKILRNISIGYQVRKYEDVSQKGDKIPTLRATNWHPGEISVVAVGFDPLAQVRSNENTNEVEIINNQLNEVDKNDSKDKVMTEEEKRALELATQKQATLAEKTRQSEIRSIVKKAKLEESFADDLITRDIDVEQARKMAFDKLVEKQSDPIQSSVRVDVAGDNHQMQRQGFEESLLHRMDNKNFKITECAKQFYGKSLLRQIEQFIPRYSMESDSQFAKRAMSSSDLPLALANVAEKSLQKQYDLAPRTFDQWSRSDTLRNYKQHSQVKSGDFASLLPRAEGAEFQQGSTGEDRELVQLADYGIIHAFTSQMLINDDLGVLSRLASSGGIAASRLENKLAYSALTTNKTMNDGVVLYHSTHGNLGSAAAISATTVGEAYKLMRKQTSTDTKDPLNIVPRFFVCGPDKEVEARQFFAGFNPTKTSDINIFAGTMTVIVDAQITGNQYYFLADPNVLDTVVIYRLEGQEQPQVESRIKFSTNSLELKVAHAVAAAPMDWRGIVKNAGN